MPRHLPSWHQRGMLAGRQVGRQVGCVQQHRNSCRSCFKARTPSESTHTQRKHAHPVKSCTPSYNCCSSCNKIFSNSSKPCRNSRRTSRIINYASRNSSKIFSNSSKPCRNSRRPSRIINYACRNSNELSMNCTEHSVACTWSCKICRINRTFCNRLSFSAT